MTFHWDLCADLTQAQFLKPARSACEEFDRTSVIFRTNLQVSEILEFLTQRSFGIVLSGREKDSRSKEAQFSENYIRAVLIGTKG